MGRIMLATSASTDEEYGGTTTTDIDSIEVTLSNNQTAQIVRQGKIAIMRFTNNTTTAITTAVTGTIPEGWRPNGTYQNVYARSRVYITSSGNFELTAEAWQGFTISYLIA